jgi:acetyl-CoA carboxylase carboxyltransferase component
MPTLPADEALLWLALLRTPVGCPLDGMPAGEGWTLWRMDDDKVLLRGPDGVLQAWRLRGSLPDLALHPWVRAPIGGVLQAWTDPETSPTGAQAGVLECMKTEIPLYAEASAIEGARVLRCASPGDTVPAGAVLAWSLQADPGAWEARWAPLELPDPASRLDAILRGGAAPLDMDGPPPSTASRQAGALARLLALLDRTPRQGPPTDPGPHLDLARLQWLLGHEAAGQDEAAWLARAPDDVAAWCGPIATGARLRARHLVAWTRHRSRLDALTAWLGLPRNQPWPLPMDDGHRDPWDFPRWTGGWISTLPGGENALRLDEDDAMPAGPWTGDGDGAWLRDDGPGRALRMAHRGALLPFVWRAMARTAWPGLTFVPLPAAPDEAPTRETPGVGIHALLATPPHGTPFVWLVADPGWKAGSLTNAECDIVRGAIAVARRRNLPLVWFAHSAGARIEMERGTENLDGTAAALRDLSGWVDEGRAALAVATGPCVGAQAYWLSALTQPRSQGRLAMVESAALVLSGARSMAVAGLDMPADERDQGGWSVLGPIGHAAHWLPTHADVWPLVRRWHALLPGPPATRPAEDALLALQTRTRAVLHDAGLDGPGEVHRQPWSVEALLNALWDRPPLAPWAGWQDAANVQVREGHVLGQPLTALSVAHRLHRQADGRLVAPATLQPAGSRLIARALRSASGQRPILLLANLAGFDGARWANQQGQLEWGTEVAEAVAACRSPLLVWILTRCHGGAFVVFSRRLQPDLQLWALVGAQASVIGGSAAAGIVFGQRVEALTRQAGGGDEARRTALRQVAAEFDTTHSAARALQHGSLDRIVPAADFARALAGWLAAPRAPGDDASDHGLHRRV